MKRDIDIRNPGLVQQPLVSGVFAAMTLPRTSDGTVELNAFAHHLHAVQQAGVEGFVLNGATGEYCLTSTEELGAMLRRARDVVHPGTKLIAAIGGASFRQTLQRLEVAQAAGVDGLLLPMPYFFPYEQTDLMEFSRNVAKAATSPVLLYNLPAFTTALEPQSTYTLLAETVGIEGIKDSSGSLETVRLLTKRLPNCNRVIGNDAALHGALLEGLCDGVVSGVASVLPELMLKFYSETKASPNGEATLALKASLDELIGRLGRFPVPWGLKMIAAERGFSPLDLPLPISEEREMQRHEFIRWFRANRAGLLPDTTSAVAV